jgi:membrane protease YdiL (CAAX protease family)
MATTRPEIILAYLASLVFWVAALAIIWFGGRRWARLAPFRDEVLSQWKAALGIAAVFAAAVALRGANANAFSIVSGGIMTFCEAAIGLALARRVASFEPLPVVRAIKRREHAVRDILLMVGIALLAAAAGLLAGALGQGLARLLGEVRQQGQGSTSGMPGVWQLFFYFLSGAGIAEETVYRLVLLSLFWALTHRKWAAILLSSILFGAYHLTPLSGMYLTFWQYPLTQFLSSTFIGMVWGYVFVRRGYETAVLSHTLSDWLPIAAFMLLSK